MNSIQLYTLPLFPEHLCSLVIGEVMLSLYILYVRNSLNPVIIRGINQLRDYQRTIIYRTISTFEHKICPLICGGGNSIGIYCIQVNENGSKTDPQKAEQLS